MSCPIKSEVIVSATEFRLQGLLITLQGGHDLIHLFGCPGRRARRDRPHASDEFGQVGVEFAGCRGRCLQIAKPHQLRHVIGTPRLDPGSERGFAHAAKRLAQHDGSGRGPVDVQVAGADRVDPHLLFAVVEALEPGGQSVAGLVHEPDGFFQVLGSHHPQDRAEELGQMGKAPGLHTPFDGRRDDVRVRRRKTAA